MKSVVFFIGVVLCLAACSSRYYMKRGNIIYETGRYDKAASKYEKSYYKAGTKDKAFQAEAAQHAGRAYEQINRLKEAYTWYRRAERAVKERPEIYLKLAQLSWRLEDRETAIQYYQEYEKLFADGKGKDGLYRLEQLGEDMEEESRYVVSLKKELNSRGSDFAPSYLPGDTCTVYLASTRNGNTGKRKMKTDPVTGEGYSHIFRAE